MGRDDRCPFDPFGCSPGARGNGIGVAIVEALVQNAKTEGVGELVLLTTTAEKFFRDQFDFERTDREKYD